MFRNKSRITPFFNTKNHKNIRRINLKNKNTGKNNNPGKLKNIRGKIKIPGKINNRESLKIYGKNIRRNTKYPGKLKNIRDFPLRKAPDIVSFFQFYFRLSAFYRSR